ncbi:ribbon-helix-helix protein, CopG family [Protaetiibacter larvae]|uniref:Ribbon-helix-helix protein, CopG family n=1 Tax=Protaetiibacter larvae TaxID=2592654 RepID=A0A5C1YA43_9MICO|nr:ribbon-helix-helix protein, CopG family [Protaetiibacter larvae]QEO10490.1 ribbon-helix-helix protein, CopG family [Protaetiibacter larvae]
MKVSISLSDDDLAFLDAETASGAFPSRSAAVAAAIRALRNRDLVAVYADAFLEWSDTEEADAWGAVLRDGVA